MEAEHSMRWTRSFIILDSIQKSQSFARHGIGFDKTSSETKNRNIDCLCSHCGLTRHKSYACIKKLTAYKNNLNFLKKTYRGVTKLVPKSKPLQRWAKKNLIHPFSNKQGPKWI